MDFGSVRLFTKKYNGNLQVYREQRLNFGVKEFSLLKCKMLILKLSDMIEFQRIRHFLFSITYFFC